MVDALGTWVEVNVAYVLPQMQTVMTFKVPRGTTVGEAIQQSGIAARHPEVDWNSVAVGIFGRRTSRSTILRDHDRVEIYRPLIADPKQLRRRRAQRASQVKR